MKEVIDMATNSAEQLDTSWAAIDSMEDQVFKLDTMDFYGGDGDLDSREQEQPLSKADFERALRKVSRRVRR